MNDVIHHIVPGFLFGRWQYFSFFKKFLAIILKPKFSPCSCPSFSVNAVADAASLLKNRICIYFPECTHNTNTFGLFVKYYIFAKWTLNSDLQLKDQLSSFLKFYFSLCWCNLCISSHYITEMIPLAFLRIRIANAKYRNSLMALTHGVESFTMLECFSVR